MREFRLGEGFWVTYTGRLATDHQHATSRTASSRHASLHLVGWLLTCRTPVMSVPMAPRRGFLSPSSFAVPGPSAIDRVAGAVCSLPTRGRLSASQACHAPSIARILHISDSRPRAHESGTQGRKYLPDSLYPRIQYVTTRVPLRWCETYGPPESLGPCLPFRQPLVSPLMLDTVCQGSRKKVQLNWKGSRGRT